MATVDVIAMVVLALGFAWMTTLETVGKVDVPSQERALSVLATLMSIFILYMLFGWVGLLTLLSANIVVLVVASLFD